MMARINRQNARGACGILSSSNGDPRYVPGGGRQKFPRSWRIQAAAVFFVTRFATESIVFHSSAAQLYFPRRHIFLQVRKR